jgi:hypothetical protein
MFLGDMYGRLVLLMNEPTVETDAQFTMVAGTRKFNSAGGILMGVVDDQAVWEDSVFRLGHTGFVNVAPTMSGGTIGNYTLEYDIDIGAGYSGDWTALSGASLSAITVDPAVGFKIKIRITTTTANLVAITHLRIDTTTTSAAQANQYPLDTVDLVISASQSLVGAEIRIYDMNNIPAGSLGTELGGVESHTAATYTFTGDAGNTVWIQIMKSGYEEFGQSTVMPSIDGAFYALLTADLNA